MFTGLVQAVGEVAEVAGGDSRPRRITLSTGGLRPQQVGDSVAVDGCCLTVVENADGWLTFEAASETLRRTTVGRLRRGSRVHLEPSLRVGDPLGGHWVTGHVDAVATVLGRRLEGSALYLRLGAPAAVLDLCAGQGSVAVAGVSLTISRALAEAFEVALIPHTRAVTTLDDQAVGSALNVEADVMARYLAHLAARRGAGGRDRDEGVAP